MMKVMEGMMNDGGVERTREEDDGESGDSRSVRSIRLGPMFGDNNS